MATHPNPAARPAPNRPTRPWSGEPPRPLAILSASTAKTVHTQRCGDADSAELEELIDMRFDELQARAALADLFGEGLNSFM